ncbi:MAG: hypothetical protein SH850_07175 [Planctomycetaceae bacterium]|nr:hypothetical protein [Planctomycetaceae bacterium]
MRLPMSFALTLTTSALFAGAPIKVETVGTGADLVREAGVKAVEVEGFLASAESFKENGDKLRPSASLLALIGQALAEHPDDTKLKATGPDIRDAAMKIARATTFEEAQAAWPMLKSALDGKATGQAAKEFDWAKLSKMHPAMEEMNGRAAKFRRVLRRPKDPAEDSSHVMAIALAAIATHADTHEVKDKADLPEWYRLATALHENMAASAAAVRAKDTATAGMKFTAGMDTCQQCHDKFQK